MRPESENAAEQDLATIATDPASMEIASEVRSVGRVDEDASYEIVQETLEAADIAILESFLRYIDPDPGS